MIELISKSEIDHLKNFVVKKLILKLNEEVKYKLIHKIEKFTNQILAPLFQYDLFSYFTNCRDIIIYCNGVCRLELELDEAIYAFDADQPKLKIKTFSNNCDIHRSFNNIQQLINYLETEGSEHND